MFSVTFLKETYFADCKICACLPAEEKIGWMVTQEPKAISKKRGGFCFINTEIPSAVCG